MNRLAAEAARPLAVAALTLCWAIQAVAGDKLDSLVDPQDGWLDASAFLDTAYGFVPVIAPITEPAVGYGAVGALVFIDRQPPVEGQPFVRPNIAAVGGLATENGTDGLFAAHLGTWRDGRLKTTVGVATASVNLAFFGLGDREAAGANGLDYSIEATGGIVGGNYRVGSHPLWLGLRYALADTQVRLRESDPEPPGILPGDRNLRLAGLTPSLTLDTRDNFFTPTRGWYVDLSAPVFREDLGGDRDFELMTLSAMYFRPLSRSLYFGIRGAGKTSSDGTPFYLRPYVSLRGVPALRYQGEQEAELEAELRWQFHPRFSLVGFGGGGIATSDMAGRKRDQRVGAGGVGFRYLVARTYGLHMGLDVATGPDDPVLYVVFGTQWLRP
jgi:hypothetical protein